jgi:hypothetical protein
MTNWQAMVLVAVLAPVFSGLVAHAVGLSPRIYVPTYLIGGLLFAVYMYAALQVSGIGLHTPV